MNQSEQRNAPAIADAAAHVYFPHSAVDASASRSKGPKEGNAKS